MKLRLKWVRTSVIFIGVFSKLVCAYAHLPVSESELERLFNTAPTHELKEFLQNSCIDESVCKAIAEWAIQDWQKRRHSILSPSRLAKKNIVIVGAGIHTTIFVSNLQHVA